MRKIPLFLVLALAVVFAGAATAQDCPSGCERSPAPKAAASKLSARIDALAAAAAKGDKPSAETLAKLQKIAGVESADALKTFVADYEQYACAGCKQSAAILTKLEAALQPAAARTTLSARVAELVAASKSGCGKSNEALAPLFKDCETKCCKQLVATIRRLEADAAKLEQLQAKVPGKAETPVSERLAKLDPAARQKLAAELCGEGCQDCECCEQKKAGCDDLVACAKKLEASTLKLKKLEALLPPAASPPVPPKAEAGKAECKQGCQDCGECPSRCSDAK